MDNNEVLNQEPTITEEEGLFDDYQAEDTPTEAKGNETATQEQDVPEQPFLNIKYNKQDKGLTKEEAIEMAQKGMNYDKVNDRYNSLNNQLSELAEANGMTVDEYLNSLATMQKNFGINKELQALKQQYPDADEALLKELAESKIAQKASDKLKKQNEETDQKAEADKLAMQHQIDVFKEEYPDLEPDKLDDKVYELMEQGYSLLEAYSKWERQQAKLNAPNIANRKKIEEQNARNSGKGYGNVGNAGNIENDAFMEGFLKG